jgi:hypothetical protein
MKHTISVNQSKALELGLADINQAHVFDLLTTASAWAVPVLLHFYRYYWVNRQVIMDELPMLGLKRDSVYRHLKALDDLGVIDYKKSVNRDFIRLTNLGKTYLSSTVLGLDAVPEAEACKGCISTQNTAGVS